MKVTARRGAYKYSYVEVEHDNVKFDGVCMNEKELGDFGAELLEALDEIVMSISEEDIKRELVSRIKFEIVDYNEHLIDDREAM